MAARKKKGAKRPARAKRKGSPIDQPVSPVIPEVRTTRLVLVDSESRERIRIEAGERNPAILLIGADRVIRLELALLPDDTPFIAAYDEKEDLVVEGRVTRTGVPMAWSRREVGRPGGDGQEDDPGERTR